MKVTILQAALQRGKSLYELSAEVGVDIRTVYYWQQLNRIPKSEHLDTICAYLGCGIHELLSPEKPPPKEKKE